MTYRTKLAFCATPAVLLSLAAPHALAAPVGVTVRVEGANQTIFEGKVTTDGHDVTTASGGTHRCDGTNGGVHPEPGPTGTAALDDAARLGRFTWDGTYSDGFDDFFVNRVGPDSNNSSQFWGLLVNSEFSQSGGCQQRVGEGDEVLWAFDAFSKARALRLTGPGTATTGRPVTVRVSDGRDGSPQAGANVRGSVSDGNGNVALTFPEAGVYRLKAEKSDSVRSNVLVVCADPEGADPCTSADRTAPTVRLLLASGYASTNSTSRTLPLAWQGADTAEGAGVARYLVETREEGGARFAQAGDDGWRTLATTTEPTTRFRAGAGKTYGIRVTAIDRAGNRSPSTRRRLVVPVDDRDRRIVRFSRGWKRLARKGAWGRFVVRSRRRGAVARVSLDTGHAALIGRRLPKGGRVRVSLGGWSRVVSLRDRSGHRRVLLRTPKFSRRARTLKLQAVGGGPIEIDAVAPLR